MKPAVDLVRVRVRGRVRAAVDLRVGRWHEASSCGAKAALRPDCRALPPPRWEVYPKRPLLTSGSTMCVARADSPT
eukprot:scaffold5994_cov54-Phaeocystis_antarctica.AAC.4